MAAADYSDIITGAEVILVQLLKRLREKYEIRLIGTKTAEGIFRRENVKTRFRAVPAFGYRGSVYSIIFRLLLRSIAILPALRDLLLSDVIFTPTDFLPDVFAPFLTKMIRPRVVWVTRTYHLVSSPTSRPGNPLVNMISYGAQQTSLLLMRRRSDLLLTLSATYDQLLDRGFPKPITRFLDPGIELERIRRAKPAEGEGFDAVFVGRLHVTKGIYDLLHIWKAVVQRNPRARLAIIGGPNRMVNNLKEVAGKLGVEGNVQFFGFLPSHDEVFGVLKQSKMYVTAEYENGWSVSASEAMACGLPVVAYSLKTFGTSFKRGYRTTTIGDQEGMAEIISYLLTNEEERERLGREALEQARDFSWQRTSSQFISMLESLLKVRETEGYNGVMSYRR